jgi:pyridoxine 5-phosphate synthase
MTRLSVNINKIALIRNAREGNHPDIFKIATDIEHFGAEGITVHPRPDERHIRYSDLPELKELVKTEFNIEGYPNKRYIETVLKIRPDQCTLVPDSPDALTSDNGWDTKKHKKYLIEIIKTLKSEGIRVSIFLNADPGLVLHASETGADRIELYTGPYAWNYYKNKEKAIEPYIDTTEKAKEFGIGVNAGHDLNLDNLKYFITNIPDIAEVSIGHSLVCDSLYFGLHNTIQMYKSLIKT